MNFAGPHEHRYLSFIDVLQSKLPRQAEQRAYTFLGEEGRETDYLTYLQLDLKARAVAALLQEMKARGERVLLLCPAGLEYVVAFYGCLYASATAVPSYPPRKNGSLARLLNIINDARPLIAITVSSVLANIEKQFDQEELLKGIQWICIDKLEFENADKWKAGEASEDTLAFLQYTSGSTASPKGVMVSHRNLLHNEAMMRVAFGHADDTVMISWLPVYHDMGLIGIMLAAVYNGVPAYLLSPNNFLQHPILWLQAFTRYKGTFSGAPNFAYDLCVQKISAEEREQLDLSSWKLAGNGSEPVRAATIERFNKTFASCGLRPEVLYPCYGLAEATLFVSGGRPLTRPQISAFDKAELAQLRAVPTSDSLRGERLVSCGRTWTDGQVVIVNPKTLQRCEEGRVGEIWIGGQSIAQGYWNNAHETQQTFGARLSDDTEGRFLRTGDLGVVHDGDLYVTGRIKDLIILRGRNHYPQDIELTTERSHAAIRPGSSAAFTIDHGGSERLVVVAEVRREQRQKIDPDEVLEKVRRALSTEHEVELFDLALIPPGTALKTSSGKAQRRATRIAYLSGSLPTLFAPRNSNGREPATQSLAPVNGDRATSMLKGWLATELSTRMKVSFDRIEVNKPLAAYGLDSLVAAELIGSIQDKFGVLLPIDSLFQGEPDIDRIATLISEASKQGSRLTNKTELSQTSFDTHKRHHVVADKVKRERLEVATTEPESHAFYKYVNPVLGRLLSQLQLNKSFVRGEGCYLYDQDGRTYLDFLAQYGALPFGFNHSRIWQAIEQVRERLEPSFVQPSFLNAAGELAQKLIDIAPPGMRYVTFANSGAEAVEAAIKLCKSANGRDGVLSVSYGFHGKTLGALSATNNEKYQKCFGAPVKGYHYVAFGDAEELERALSTRAYSAFIVEPIQGEGGMMEPPPGYLAKAQALCKATGTLMIVDEIQTGLGRTGVMFACESERVTPDVITVAKALGGGIIPIGACLCTSDVYNDDFALKHTSTFAGNTLACRIGLATIALLEENDFALIRQAAANGARMKHALRALQQKYPHIIRDVRGRGYMLGISFGITRYNWGKGLIGNLGQTEVLTSLVVSHMLNHAGVRLGYTLNQGGVLRVEPPLIATWKECEFFLDAFASTLKKLELRNTASFTSHLTGMTINKEAEPAPNPTRLRRLSTTAKDEHFAFIVHPLTSRSYIDVDPSLAALSDRQIGQLSACVADNFDPFVVGDVRIVSKIGRTAYGEFILVPRTTEELVRMSYRQALSEIEAAITVANERGARIVGLGAYTSIVTGGGLYLKKRPKRPGLTTGNSYTAVAARQSIDEALKILGRKWSECAVAVVGATGSIGRLLSILLAQNARKLILIGNPEHQETSERRLLSVTSEILKWVYHRRLKGEEFAQGSLAARLACSLPLQIAAESPAWIKLAEESQLYQDAIVLSCDSARWLPAADVVVTTTSSINEIVRAEDLKPGSIVCDISRPRNVSGCTLENADVFVIDGGVVHLPEESTLNFDFDLTGGRVYACMAETMMRVLEQQHHDCSLGLDLDVEMALGFERSAVLHGFRVDVDEARLRDSAIRQQALFSNSR